MTLILGIDPGSRKTGFGVIEVDGNRHRYVTSGVIHLRSDALPSRLKDLFDNLCALVELHCPQQVAVEEVFLAKNASSALKLGQARGAAIAACVSRALEVSEYTARQIKQAVVGRGNAQKVQVQHMVCTLLALPAPPAEDAADALAAALCHAHMRQGLASIAASTGAVRGRMRRGRLA